MEQNLEGLTIIDLISEKHIVLRRETEDRWAETDEEEINHTEGLLLAKIGMKRVSLAEVARQANVSRQAMFKCAKKLEERGYLEFKIDEDGAKYTTLTEKGEVYCQRSQTLKQEIEDEIARALGKEQLKRLKALLQKDWLCRQ